MSTALILAGCICIAVPFVIEAIEYPWSSSADEADLADPPPPDFKVYSYEEYLEGRTLSAQTPVIDRSELPGGDEYTRNPAEESAVPGAARHEEPVFVLLGTVKIPRINISENLFMGTDKQMNHGIGHLEGTAMPGERGNAVIAAHRTSSAGKSPFKHLDKMQAGDSVTVSFGDEAFVYEVIESFIVSRHDLWVLQPAEDEPYLLTLVTCDPMHSFARRENRLIVRARLNG